MPPAILTKIGMQEDLIQLINEYRVAVSTKAKTEAISALYECLNPKIFLYFAARVSRQDAEDLRSITLSEILKGIRDIKGTTSKQAWKWCFKVARRKLAKYYDDTNSEITESMDPELLEEQDGASTGEEPIRKLDLQIDVLGALLSLRETNSDCFFVLWDHFIVGIDYDELAEKAEKTVDAVRMQISRCADKLEPLL